MPVSVVRNLCAFRVSAVGPTPRRADAGVREGRAGHPCGCCRRRCAGGRRSSRRHCRCRRAGRSRRRPAGARRLPTTAAARTAIAAATATAAAVSATAAAATTAVEAAAAAAAAAITAAVATATAAAARTALGGLACDDGRGVLLALDHGAPREVDAALAVDFDDHDLDLVADADLVLDAGDAVIGEFGDVDEAVLAGQDLDERAEVHDAGDAAGVDLADFDVLGHALDDRDGALRGTRRRWRR